MKPRKRRPRDLDALDAGALESYEDPSDIPEPYRPEDPNDYEAQQEMERAEDGEYRKPLRW